MANTVMTVPTARKPLAPRGCPRDRFSAMAVPDFQTIMGPMVAMLGDRQEHSVTELRARLADHFSLTPEDLAAEIPSGRAKLFANRVGWATTHLYRSGVIERPKRSVYRITPRGEGSPRPASRPGGSQGALTVPGVPRVSREDPDRRCHTDDKRPRQLGRTGADARGGRSTGRTDYFGLRSLPSCSTG
jgi:hypothetical protein